MHQLLTRRRLLKTAVTTFAGASVPLLSACGSTAAESGAATSTLLSASAAKPTTSAGTTATSSAAVTRAATATTLAGPTTSAVAASVTAPAAGSTALRIGSWLTRPTNQAVYNDQLIGPYAKLQPNIKITVEYTDGTSTYLTKMLAETAAGDPPDMLEMNFDNTQSFADKKALVALDPLIAQSKIKLDDYVTSALELGRYPQGSGKYWAWQTMLAVGVLYYNKTMFQNAGVPVPTDAMDYQTTLLEAAQKLTKQGSDEAGSFWGFSINYFTRSMLFSYGFQEVANDGKQALVDSPESINAHQYWVDLLNKYKVSFPDTARKTFNVKEGPFETGHLGMSLDGSYEVQAWQQVKSLDWDIAVPARGPAGQYSVIKGAPAHGLSPLSKHQDAAWGFLSWWILNETPDQVVNPGNLPSRLAALKDYAAAQLKQHPMPAGIGKLVDIAAKNGKAVQVPPHSADVWNAYLKARKDILAGTVAVADGLHAAAQQINGILAQP